MLTHLGHEARARAWGAPRRASWSRRRLVRGGQWRRELARIRRTLCPREGPALGHRRGARGGDSASPQRLRRGTVHPPRIEGSSVIFAYTGLCETRYETTVSFGTYPTELTEDHALFELNLSPDRSISIEVRAVPMVGQWRHTQPPRPPIQPACRDAFERDANVSSELDALFLRRRPAPGRPGPSHSRLACAARSVRSPCNRRCGDPVVLRPVRARCVDCWLRGADTQPDFATEALRTLAAYQGKKFDNVTEEEPGKIFHELRFGEMARCREIPHSPYYGSIDSTPLFVVVAEAAHRFAADGTFRGAFADYLRAVSMPICTRRFMPESLVPMPLREPKPFERILSFAMPLLSR